MEGARQLEKRREGGGELESGAEVRLAREQGRRGEEGSETA